MNTLNTCANLIPIIAPELNDVNYAANLNEVMCNINNNFVMLANHDFIKGESGKSVEINDVAFFDENGNKTKYAELLFECIKGQPGYKDTVIIDDEGKSYTIWDNFNSDTAGCIQMIFNTDNDVNSNSKRPISSLQYIFLDGRFANTAIGKISNKSQYDNIVDLSCVVVYDKSINNGNGGFKVLNNSLATLYYDNKVGLCWKINGKETGIPTQGIPGINGKNSKIYIVKCSSSEKIESENDNNEVYTSRVEYIHDKTKGFVNITKDIYNEVDNMSALILVKNPHKMRYDYYFGTLHIVEEVLTAIFNIDSSLNASIETEEITNYFKSINLINNSNYDSEVIDTTNNASTSPVGLFVPISTNINNNEQSAHLISAIYEGEDSFSVENTPNYNDLLISPVNDINSIIINSDNKLCVDRYIKFYDDVFGHVTYKLIKSINSKNTFIECIRENCIQIPEKDIDTILTNLPIKFNELLENGHNIYQWRNNDVNENHHNIFTIDVNPTSNSIVLLTEKIDDNNNLVFDTSRKIIDFVPEFNNSFKTNDNASLNINYDVNITKESMKSANLNVNGEISANSASIGHQTEYIDSETGMPIYDGNLFVGSTINVGDNTGVIRAGQLDLGRTGWSLRQNNNLINNQLIINNSLPEIEGFESTFVINTDVNVSKSIKINRDRLSNYDTTEAINYGDLVINKTAKRIESSFSDNNAGIRKYIISNESLSNDEIFNLIKSPLYANRVINYDNIEYTIGTFDKEEFFNTFEFSLQQNPLINNEKWSITINFNNIIHSSDGYKQPFYVIPSFKVSNENGKLNIDNLLGNFWENVPGAITSLLFAVIEKIDIVIQSNTQINKLFVSVKIDGYLTGENNLKTFISVIPYDLPTKK